MKTKEIDLGSLADLIAKGPHGKEKQEKQAEAISSLQQTLMLMYKRQKPYEVPVKSDGNRILFGLIGDTQIGSLYQQKDAVTAFYTRCAEEGVKEVLHTGDVLDGWKVYKGQEFELRPDGKSWPEQKALFVNEMPKITGMKTIFITGNHDASFKNLVGLVVGDELSQARPDWKFVGQDVGDVTLQTENGQAFRVRLLHPGGGTAYAVSYHAQKIVEAMSGGQKPDLLAIGHYHKAVYMPQYRNVACLETGCFQSQTPFMVRQSLAAHVGGWIITAYLNDRKKLTNRIQAEWIGFFEEQKTA
jgi:predicted phosphodiesterase